MKTLGVLLFTIFLCKAATADILPPVEMVIADEDLLQWEKECTNKNTVSCYNLGVNAAINQYDEVEAAIYYRKACDLDDALGCFNLGGVLIKKFETRPEGLSAFEKACKMSKDPKQPYKIRKANRSACTYAKIIKKNMDLNYHPDLINKMLNSQKKKK